MTNEEKAREYDSLIGQYDKLAREVSLIKSKFDLSTEDEKKVSTLKQQMSELERKANNLMTR
jgi:hypothetical protein